MSSPTSIATDGTNIWILDSGTDRIDYFAGGAKFTDGSHSPTSSFALSGGFHGDTDPTGLAERNNTLWVSDASSHTGKVFVYSTSSTVEGEWGLDSTDTDPAGITVNPSAGNTIWTVDGQTLKVYAYANATTLTSGSESAASSFALASQDANPQGIVDPTPTDTFDASSGNWDVPGDWSLSAVPTSSDAVVIPSGDTVTINSSTGAASALSITVSGSLVLSGETLTISSSSTVSGTLTLETNGILDDSGLTLSGSGATFDWDAGTIEGSGDLTLDSGTTLETFYQTVDGNVNGKEINIGAHDLDQPLLNYGTVTLDEVSGSSLESFSGTSSGTITNESGGTFDVEACSTVSNISVTNDGTLNFALGSTSTTFSVAITNSGTIDLQSGTVDVDASMTNSGTLDIQAGTMAETEEFGIITNEGTVTIASGATLSFTSFSEYNQTAGTTTVDGAISGNSYVTFTISGGTLAGTGTITSDVSNAGTISPGNASGTTSPGILTISGTYTQTSTGILAVDVAGTTAGDASNDYSQLIVSSTVTLAGSLSMSMNYVNQAGNSYQFITASSTESGTLSGLSQGGTFTLNYAVYGVSYSGGTSGDDFVVTTDNVPDIWIGGASGNWTTASDWPKTPLPFQPIRSSSIPEAR